MSKPISLLVLAFSFILFEPRLFRRKYSLLIQREGTRLSWDQEISTEKNKRKEKRKAQRQYKNRKFKKRKQYREKHYRLKGSHCKDHRYSNQRTLRRLHTNM
jgi:hypothetical protein